METCRPLCESARPSAVNRALADTGQWIGEEFGRGLQATPAHHATNFHRSRMAAMADRMAQVAKQRIAGWADQAERPVDIAADMRQPVLEVILQTMFTTSMIQHIDRISHAQQAAFA
jgi:cytochrome P450